MLYLRVFSAFRDTMSSVEDTISSLLKGVQYYGVCSVLGYTISTVRETINSVRDTIRTGMDTISIVEGNHQL